ncbi:hypothetical protein GO755_25530 [Spirosoma sp. HMF4905]|uniref:Piwi domain-containing protein n=1 Tax=Spirosoma arboris TaxID=2682092 RepID=A0A7K1SI85_9BACT|nr:hypothetical protein [Spirosoma arboris]MVM33424.1 hypothetical protein [Spirosoma arboris]
MSITIDISEIPEPQLEFGGPGPFTDPKTGLINAGPFDLLFGAAHRTEIRLGIVGPSLMNQRAVTWFSRCRGMLSSGMSNSVQYPDFPGFQAIFRSELKLSSQWTVDLNEDKLAGALSEKSQKKCFEDILSLYAAGFKKLATSEIGSPDVIICCLPDEVVDRCWSIQNTLTAQEKKALEALKKKQASGQLSLFDEPVEEISEDLERRDFRRALKAKAMAERIPIQIVTDRALLDAVNGQDPATRAWHLCVSIYYKAGGIPWRLRSEGPETCFVGISFYHLKTNLRHLVKSCIAQGFSSEGEGFALRGVSIPPEKAQKRDVHLSEEQAFYMGQRILSEYHDRTGGYPLRMVIHKSSWYNDDEINGFRQAFKNIPVVELINLMHTDFRLVNYGSYPPKRGTLCTVNESAYYLFNTGFMPSLGTYPGPHIPRPLEIRSDQPFDIYRTASDIMSLSRMNWNTSSITGGQPVTLFFSRQVGGIMSEYGENNPTEPPSSFRFYI